MILSIPHFSFYITFCPHSTPTQFYLFKNKSGSPVTKWVREHPLEWWHGKPLSGNTLKSILLPPPVISSQ